MVSVKIEISLESLLRKALLVPWISQRVYTWTEATSLKVTTDMMVFVFFHLKTSKNEPFWSMWDLLLLQGKNNVQGSTQFRNNEDTSDLHIWVQTFYLGIALTESRERNSMYNMRWHQSFLFWHSLFWQETTSFKVWHHNWFSCQPFNSFTPNITIYTHSMLTFKVVFNNVQLGNLKTMVIGINMGL